MNDEIEVKVAVSDTAAVQETAASENAVEAVASQETAASENAVASQETVHEHTKTEQFKIHLQKIVKDVIGTRISKADAWELFKAFQHGTVQFVLAQEFEVGATEDDDEALGSRRLPLAGVGSFEVIQTKPRASKAGMVKDAEGNFVRDENLKVWPFVPRYRFYPSTKISEMLEQHFGLADHGITEKNYGIYNTAEVVEAPAAEPAASPKAEKPAKAKKVIKEAVPAEVPADATAPAAPVEL